MTELAIVCGTLVLLSAFASVFYLSHQLAGTNRQLLDSNHRILDSALAINSDEREYMRIRFEADVGKAVPSEPRRRHVAPPVAVGEPGISIPLDPNTGEPLPVQHYNG